MADKNDVRQAILDQINAEVTGARNNGVDYAARAKDLAEAYAWLTSTAQPHGGSTSAT